MAAILQLRQGSTSTYITQGPNIAEPFFDTGSNILVVGKSATEVIKLTKLDESNLGSFDITGDYSGSNLYLSGDLTASNATLSGDITIGGNIILGDEIQDNITISGQFNSDLIPSQSLQYNLGSQTKKWNHLYASSASIDNIDLVNNLPSGVVSSSNQIDTGSTHFQEGVQLYSINGVTPLSGLYGSANGLGVQIRGLSADGLSFDGPGNLIIDTGSDYFISGAQEASLLGLPEGTVSSSQQVIDFLPTGIISGSDQILGGTNIASSSQQIIDFLPTGTVSGSSQFTDGSFILSSSLHPAGFDVYTSEVDNRLNPLESSSVNLTLVSHSHDNKIQLDTINQNLSNTSDVQFNSIQVGTFQSTNYLEVLGTASFDSNVTIYGNLTTFGTQSIINSTNLSIADNMIYLNSGSTITNPDLGFAGNYNDGTYAHTGLFRDASDGVYKFYEGYTPEPEGSIDISHVTFALAPIQVESLDAILVTSDTFIGTGSQLVFPNTNIVSSSQQVIDFLPTNTVSGSSQILLSSVDDTDYDASPIINFGTGFDVSNMSLPISVTLDFYEFTLGNGLNATGNTSLNIDRDILLYGSGVVSGSSQITELLPTGVVSGSSQITDGSNIISSSHQLTSSLDAIYLHIDGNNVITGSDQITSSLNDVYAQSSSLHTLIGNFPTSGSLGTAAFYNVSSSLADDPSVIPNVKAVFDYINNTIGAADITGVSASLGLSGGGDGGYVSLSLDTASVHFQEGVELYGTSNDGVVNIFNTNNVLSGSYLGTATTSNLTEGTNLYWTETRFSSSLDIRGVITSSVQVNADSITNFDSNVKEVLNNETVVSGSLQISNHITSQSLIGINISNPISYGSDGELQINGTTDGYSGVLQLLSGSVSTYVNYSTESDKMINFQGEVGYGLQLIPDGSSSKAWTIDTDGDLVGHGSADLYAQYLYGDISNTTITTGSITDREILFKNTNDRIDGSSIFSVPATSTIAINDSTPNTAGADGELIINGTTSGYSGILTQDISGTTVYNQYATSADNLVNMLAGAGYGLYFSVDGDTKNWTIDTDGDLVAGGNYDVYAQDFIGTGSQLVFPNTNIVSSSQQVINFLPTGTVSGSVVTTLNGTGVLSGSAIDNGFVDLTSTQTIGGTKTFNDIVVNGTGSFAYFISTESELNVIGQSFIVLNNDTPTERYAGLAVYDSGSAGVTASLQFDGQTNDWFYEYSDDGGVTTDHGAVIFGPEYSVKGTPTYPTNNTIQKGNGAHHLLDSTITDDGTTITLGSDSIILGVGEFSSFTEITGSVSIQQGLNVEGNATFSNAQFDDISASTVSATGDIVAYASSDRRLKDKIVPIPFALDKINQIGGYSFEWNTQKQDIYNGKDYGVVAQEIEEILPELVQTRENGYKAVKYDKLVSLLIEGIKELSQEVNELKEKLNRE